MATFFALLAICAGNSPVPGEFPAQRPVMRSFDVFFDQHPNKRLSKQWWCWWFETLSVPLWRLCTSQVSPSRQEAVGWRQTTPSSSRLPTCWLRRLQCSRRGLWDTFETNFLIIPTWIINYTHHKGWLKLIFHSQTCNRWSLAIDK